MSDFTFIDLFAGIGGMRIAFEDLGGKCVFASEIEPHASKVYEDNFGVTPQHDIIELDPSDRKQLPRFDILLGGFPCQAFSLAGKQQGFNDDRGKMFNYIDEILRVRKPKAFLLENVKGLVSNNHGETLKYILKRLDNLDYDAFPKVLNSADFNVPQKRERIYIVGFRKKYGIKDFDFPAPLDIEPEKRKNLGSIRTRVPVPADYYLSQGYLDCLKRHREEQRRMGRGYSYHVMNDDSEIPNTLLGGGMGRERNLIIDPNIVDYTTRTRRKTPINDEYVRNLTPREFLRIQGFPDDFIMDVPKTYAYKLVGNSVAIDVVYYIGLEMMKKLVEKEAIKCYSTRPVDSKKYVYDLTKVN